MANSTNIVETDMWQEIVSLFKKRFTQKYHQDNLPDIIADKTTSKPIPRPTYDKLLGFFSKEVLLFAELLEKSSCQLETGASFDLHLIFNKISKESENIIELGEQIVSGETKHLIDFTKKAFRYLIWPWIGQSYFVRRGLLKPCGYPGDYIIVEDMYDGNAKSFGLGYIYDVIFINTQLCQGLRNRKDYMKQVLNNFLRRKSGAEFNLLNVGCGGAREIRELCLADQGQGLSIYLMDFDKEATDFAQNQLNSKVPKAQVLSLNLDVRDLNPSLAKQQRLKQCDLIYSIGLFDYLPDRVLMKILEVLMALLKNDGILVFAHKDYTVYNPRIADWFCDWSYYPRTREEFEKILNKIGVKSGQFEFSREKDGYIFFVEVKKQGV